jgi:hypothetical protein
VKRSKKKQNETSNQFDDYSSFFFSSGRQHYGSDMKLGFRFCAKRWRKQLEIMKGYAGKSEKRNKTWIVMALSLMGTICIVISIVITVCNPPSPALIFVNATLEIFAFVAYIIGPLHTCRKMCLRDYCSIESMLGSFPVILVSPLLIASIVLLIMVVIAWVFEGFLIYLNTFDSKFIINIIIIFVSFIILISMFIIYFSILCKFANSSVRIKLTAYLSKVLAGFGALWIIVSQVFSDNFNSTATVIFIAVVTLMMATASICFEMFDDCINKYLFGNDISTRRVVVVPVSCLSSQQKKYYEQMKLDAEELLRKSRVINGVLCVEIDIEDYDFDQILTKQRKLAKAVPLKSV